MYGKFKNYTELEMWLQQRGGVLGRCGDWPGEDTRLWQQFELTWLYKEQLDCIIQNDYVLSIFFMNFEKQNIQR